ncbi:hypothetical protein OIU79_016283 [Salix purpurea]|uniref:Uncharacterized protein n=1 Tax=Salix purpurea TaxID=77065 RepID=A0A9Q0PDU0_SALPP|nr:hypothetical protein OIU79_016283 [Salix purpurea]
MIKKEKRKTQIGGLIGPKKSSHGELPLLLNISGDWQPILSEQAIKFPLRHGLVLGSGVSWVVQWHLEVPTPLLCVRPTWPIAYAWRWRPDY